MENNLTNLGALWRRESKDGNEYYWGKFENAEETIKQLADILEKEGNFDAYRIQMFFQQNKKKAQHPDATITFHKFTPSTNGPKRFGKARKYE